MADRIAIARPVIGEAELEAVGAPLRSGWLTQGPMVAAFEERFAERHGVARALATTSCTTALHLILDALGIGPGDEVVVPSFTWVATANVVRMCGATPVLADVDLGTYDIDPASVAALITERTRAVIAVHLFGLCADVDAIAASIPPDVAIVEDAACAVGAGYHGRSAGTLGVGAAFSFHPRKIITTGEGGMVTTDDPELADRIDRLRNHGASVSEEVRHLGPQPYLMPAFDEVGFNYRMTDLQGAVGLAQLDRLNGLLAERRARAGWYGEQLGSLDWLRLPEQPDGYEHSWQAYVTVVDEARAPAPRNEVMRRLFEQGIDTRPGTHAVSALGAYRDTSSVPDAGCPRSEALAEQSMAIPLHNAMTDEEYERVVTALHAI